MQILKEAKRVFTPKTDKGQIFLNKEGFKITFANKHNAQLFNNTIEAMQRAGNKIPYQVIY